VALVAVDVASVPARAAPLLRTLLKDPVLAQVRILLFGDAGVNEGDARTDSVRLGTLPREHGEHALRAAIQHLFHAPPAGLAPQRNDDPLALRSDASAQARPLRGRVLLVEDDAVNLKVAQRLLALHGLNVDTAGNGEEALVRLRERRYDLVLMDCQMPVMDGLAASLHWREIERERNLPPTPIAAMTAYAMAGDRARCLASGMDDYLSKPLSRQRLETLLLRWLAPEDENGARTPSSLASIAQMPAVNEAVPEASAAVLDVDAVDELRALMGNEFDLLVQVYLDETPRKLRLLEEAAAGADADAMIAQAHTLKSSSDNLGARTLAGLARTLEEGLRDGSIDASAAPAHIERIAGEYRCVALQLRALSARA